ncbi:hypothetical protein ZWY2020_058851 [Hordeum vulgare]|nr:hypothetical protein ZWY2020_058851 [Hordeum vulgare]
MQLEIERAMLEGLETPLTFEDGGRSLPRSKGSKKAMNTDRLNDDDILPCIANHDAPSTLSCILSPPPAIVGFHVSAVTQQVYSLITSGCRMVAV